MLDLSKTLTFNDYLKNYPEEKRKVQCSILEKTKLSVETMDRIKKIDKPINMIVFTESYCPDCIVTLPFAKRISEANNNIRLYIMPLKGNEALLEEYAGEKRIPTVMTFKENMEPVGIYIEMPKALKERMIGMNEEERKRIIDDYREGKYNKLIEDELLNIL